MPPLAPVTTATVPVRSGSPGSRTGWRLRGRGSTQDDRQAAQPADQRAAAVGQLDRVDGQGQSGPAVQQRADRDLTFQPGQRGPDAEVDAVPEGQGPACLAVQPKLRAVGEPGLVAV